MEKHLTIYFIFTNFRVIREAYFFILFDKVVLKILKFYGVQSLAIEKNERLYLCTTNLSQKKDIGKYSPSALLDQSRRK